MVYLLNYNDIHLMWIMKANNLRKGFTDFGFLLFTKHLFLFCNDFVPIRIDFLFAESAIKKYSTKISPENFYYALHWSCPGIVVKTFQNTSEGITKKMIFLKSIFQGF